jgi:hypothetical protein
VALALVLSACIVQGGEENGRETDSSWVGVIKFEAVNQDGEVVGSGCTIDAGKFYDQIRFHAAAGDRVELTERFEAVVTTAATAEKHVSEPEYWCAQTETRRYDQALDARCWKSIEPDTSDACFLERGLVGEIESVELLPEIAPPTDGKLDGFKLSIAVRGSGKQCVQMRCTDSGIGREQLAFVVE